MYFILSQYLARESVITLVVLSLLLKMYPTNIVNLCVSGISYAFRTFYDHIYVVLPFLWFFQTP